MTDPLSNPEPEDSTADAAPEPAPERSSGQIPGRVEPDQHAVMSFGDHLEDLRRRLIYSILGVLPIFFVAFAFRNPLIELLITPAREALIEGGQASTLISLGMIEIFAAAVHLSFVITVLLGSPWLLYQLWLFVAPGLYRHERRFVHILLPFSGLLVVTSMAFMYIVVLPVILAFFVGFGSQITSPEVEVAPLPDGVVLPEFPILEADPERIVPGNAWVNADIMQLRIALPNRSEPDGRPEIRAAELIDVTGITQQYRIREYLKSVLNLGLAFGVAFQTPVVVVLLGWVGLIDPLVMGRYRRYAVAACAVLGALLTPADPVSMMLLAGPLYLLYELGLLILRVVPVSRIVGDLKEPRGAGDE
ncbi:MAG: twin-arginine translocase subunit TatC [Planctomycetota bacterium]